MTQAAILPETQEASSFSLFEDDRIFEAVLAPEIQEDISEGLDALISQARGVTRTLCSQRNIEAATQKAAIRSRQTKRYSRG